MARVGIILKAFGIVAVIIIAVFVVGSAILMTDGSETARVKDLVRDSEHLNKFQKDTILNAIDTTCQQGYMHGSGIGDAVLAECLATYEKKAKGGN